MSDLEKIKSEFRGDIEYASEYSAHLCPDKVLEYLDKLEKRTDLEKLKAVFDEIGVDYVDEGDYLQISGEISYIVTHLHFKDGKFTHID